MWALRTYRGHAQFFLVTMVTTHLSHALRNQLAIIQRDRIFTSSTVPGQMVISVFITNLVSKFIRFNAPILLDEASVNSLECNNITRAIR